ncbi:MAG: sigma-54-dependent Fis family transcriptional regulator [Candidatus Riflebacteria bacterium]|nr:sigma-54-dependent Fis family transcriptional regulator [Candidatus Riflebacteria bacterium]
MSPMEHSADAILAITGTRRCLFGENHQIKEICEVVRKVARSRGPVLIRGESGTGKEVLASAIHTQSPRANGPFLAVNAAAIPAELFESELFGHIKGSFTGADRDRIGRFEEASGGTLFLDEVGDMPLSQQAKLLRVLQCGEIHPVGASRPRRVDTRVVTATNRDLEKLVQESRFREDLYFRLSLFVITIPPLRERRDDIIALARIFTNRFAGEQGLTPQPFLTPETEAKLRDYSWPGNIRELENAIHYAVTMAENEEVTPFHLPDAVRLGRSPFHITADQSSTPAITDNPPEIRNENNAVVLPASSTALPLAEVERRHILSVLEAFGGNRTHAAKSLGISIRGLRVKLNAYAKSSPNGVATTLAKTTSKDHPA